MNQDTPRFSGLVRNIIEYQRPVGSLSDCTNIESKRSGILAPRRRLYPMGYGGQLSPALTQMTSLVKIMAYRNAINPDTDEHDCYYYIGTDADPVANLGVGGVFEDLDFNGIETLATFEGNGKEIGYSLYHSFIGKEVSYWDPATSPTYGTTETSITNRIKKIVNHIEPYIPSQPIVHLTQYYSAGLPKPEYIMVKADASGNITVPANSSAALRICAFYIDWFGQYWFSPPSERIILLGSGSPQKYNIVCYYPWTQWAAFRSIRSSSNYTFNCGIMLFSARDLGTLVLDPSDEMYALSYPSTVQSTVGYTGPNLAAAGVLKYQAPSATMPTAGEIPLYTNVSSEGILQENSPPNTCLDFEEYQGRTFYAGQPRRIIINLSVGTPADPGTPTQSISIGGITYTANWDTYSDNPLILQPDSFIPSVSWIGVIMNDPRQDLGFIFRFNNQNSDITVSTMPGQPYIDFSYHDRSPFAELGVDMPDQYSNYLANYWLGNSVYWPTDTNNSGTALLTKTNTEMEPAILNRVFFSKLNQPENVPVLNYLDIGRRGFRIIGLKNLFNQNLFVFKEDGAYLINGYSEADFQVVTFDDSLVCMNKNSLVVCNGAIYGLFNRGVCIVNSSGTIPISNDTIGDIITPYIQEHKLNNRAVATSDEINNTYILSLPELGIDLVYNWFSKTWQKWDMGATAWATRTKEDNATILGGTDIQADPELNGFFSDYNTPTGYNSNTLISDNASFTLNPNYQGTFSENKIVNEIIARLTETVAGCIVKIYAFTNYSPTPVEIYEWDAGSNALTRFNTPADFRISQAVSFTFEVQGVSLLSSNPEFDGLSYGMQGAGQNLSK
ncbi:hypothetical protein [Leptospira johnsonii]|uniref:Uncharacterized protein n=1 Tax=Leptospira johnsonii TaxID=1917820 RepID=A0A2P2D7S7_9LEPT|nr:hypothetical protein [Leptospira johnsonii]GBF40689.1 hypothetical protein LPTSP1_37070 [Leptospira johnsonii]